MERPGTQVMLYELRTGSIIQGQRLPHDSLKGHRVQQDTRRHSDAVLGQELFERAQAKPLTDPAYLKARRRDAAGGRSHGLRRARARNLDAIIAPSSAPTWLIDHAPGDHFVGAGYSMAANATPASSVLIAIPRPAAWSYNHGAHTPSATCRDGIRSSRRMHARKPPQQAAVP